MNEVMKLIISLSLSGTTLILLLLLFRPLYRERLSKSWQYYIWLVVILRLLLPIAPETSLMGTLFRSAEGNLPGATMSAPLPRDHEQISIDNLTEAEADGGQTDAAHGLTGTFPFVLWLVIALLLVMRKVTIYQSFRKYVDAGCRPIEDLELLECFGHILEAHHIKGSLDLCANNLVSSPLLIGLFRPRIILPDANLAERDLYYTVLHELTHYRRRDMLYKWLVQFILCLHWFNPCVYLMKNEINRLCELSCDERVIKALSETARKSYGDTLLNAAGAGGSYKDTLASVTLHESKELLKGRLDAIMNYKKLSKIVQFISIVLTGIVIGGAVVLGAYAAPGSRSAADTPHETDAAKSLPDYRIEYEDHIYYIYVDGADESDKPLSNVTNGFYKLVFVYKDRYTTFGTFRNKDMQNLVRNMKPQFRTMVGNGQITQDDADLYLLVASGIQGSFLSGEDFEDYNDIDGWADDPEDLDALDVLDDLDRLDELDALDDDDFDPDADNLDDDSLSDDSLSGYPKDRELLAMAEPAIVDLNRVTRAEVSGKVRNALDTCEDGKWYVIEADDCQYIYYNGLSHTYAYEPRITVSEEGDLVTINIVDLETDSPLLSRMSNYVLLAFRYALSDPDAEYELRIQYNHVPVTYTGSQAK